MQRSTSRCVYGIIQFVKHSWRITRFGVVEAHEMQSRKRTKYLCVCVLDAGANANRLENNGATANGQKHRFSAQYHNSFNI